MRRTLATGSKLASDALVSTARGFTLLELLVVIAILVMVTALFPVALDRALPSRRVATATQRLIALVHEAQMWSLASGDHVTLTLSANELSAALPEGSSSRTRDHSLILSQSTHVSLLDTDGRPVSRLLLYPDGSSAGARFVLEDNGRRAAVIVSAITGRSYILSPL